jgi:hypothetical protein
VSPPKQQIISSRRFEQAATELNDLKKAVTAYKTRAAENLRKQHSVTQSVGALKNQEQHPNRLGCCHEKSTHISNLKMAMTINSITEQPPSLTFELQLSFGS